MLGICSLSVIVLHETLLVPVLMYSSETMLWKEEISRIRAVQVDNLRGLLGIRRMDKVPNARIRELCGVTKGVGDPQTVSFFILSPFFPSLFFLSFERLNWRD